MTGAGVRSSAAFVAGLCACWLFPSPSLTQRSLGIDVSAWQGNISQSNWNTLHNVNDRDFVFIRSSRGGTTGYYNQSDASNSQGQNTLSQRYDDPYFVQNITRATAAGMLAGPYHFSRPEIVETTLNSGGIANTGADEADHFVEMAGAWMRPGYLLPVFDLEAGEGQRTDAEVTQFSIDFSDRIYEVAGVRPIMYINGNYAANVVQSPIQDYFPVLWTARYANQSDPDSIPVQTGHPKDTFNGFYGPWDDPPNTDPHPWDFWQYASTARLSGYKNGTANIDVNVAQGGTEFLRDLLVPAMWVSGSSGDWTSLASWNSGQTPVAPVQGPGQVARVGALTLPEARLPGPLDTVVLDREGEDVTVTLGSGTHEVRKLITREALDITGGSLTVNYAPVAESTPYSTLFSAPVSLTGGSLSTHTTVVDATHTFTLGGGELTFDTIDLTPHGSIPARLTIAGDVTLSPLGDATAVVQRGAGTGTSGIVSLGLGPREVTVTDGAAAVDVSIDAGIVLGTLVKSGAGVLRLTGTNYLDGAVVNEGTLLLSGAGAIGPTSVAAGATLAGAGEIGGAVTVEGTIAPDSFSAALSAPSAQFDGGSTLALDLGSASQFDRLALTGDLMIDPEASIAVTFAPGYTPSFGDSFAVVTGATSVSGAFGEVATSGPAMAARTVADGVVLEVLSGLEGDFNNDGAVDNADYTTWVSRFGEPASVLMNTGAAETVDASLYTLWRDNFGAVLPVVAQAVPEPATVCSLLTAVAALRRRGR